MKRTLWFFVVALLVVDVIMLAQRQQLEGKLRDLRRRSASAMVKTRYASEEEVLLAVTRKVEAPFPLAPARGGADDSVQIFLLTSVEDCTNCVEDEVTKLNQVVLAHPERVSSVQGFFIDESQKDKAQRFIHTLNPAPVFPMSVRNLLPQVPGATTPLVLVVRSKDGKILDAHKPVPEDLMRRDAFYSRWTAALGIS